MGLFFLTDVGMLVFFGGVSLLMIGLIQFLHERFALIGLLGIVAYLQYAKLFDAFAFARANPWWAVFWVIIFITVGAMSIWPAWWGFVSDTLEDYENEGKRLESWKAPQARDHKDMLSAWVFLWPWKMAWFLIRHPARKIKRAIFRAMETQLDKMSNSMTEKAKQRAASR